MALLEVNNLRKHFEVTKGIIWSRPMGWIKAVDGVSFRVEIGETLGLVGESGCGKTTTGRCLVGLETPTAGDIIFEGKNLCSCNDEELRSIRQRIQYVFQDPYGSLDPRQKAKDIIAEALVIDGKYSENEIWDSVKETMNLVGLDTETANRYPHMFSGGQRQRLAIARSIICRPTLIICDEPVSALDVSIQAQIINLLLALQRKLGISYLLIAHDLSVVKHVSTWVAVMYLGKIVELVRARELFKNPLHFYTQALISAVPIPNPVEERKRNRVVLTGEVPSPMNPPSGCSFHHRCWEKMDICAEQEPALEEVSPDHWASCHLIGD